MGLYLRGKTWWMRYSVDGVRQRMSTETCDEATARAIYEATLAANRGEGDAPELGPMTVARYSKGWLKDRRARNLESVAEDEARMRDHVLPKLGALALSDLKPAIVQGWLRGLKQKTSARTGRLLAPRTIRHCYRALFQLCEEAVADGLLPANPCKLKRGDLPAKQDADPTWRAGAVFARAEVERLISDDQIPADRRVWYALHFLTGMRPGEGAALRWRDYDPEAQPLGRLTVARAMDRKRKREKGTKTGAVRTIPVHPTLAALLAEWKLGPWQDMLRPWRSAHDQPDRAPGLDDLIIPSRRGKPRSNSIAGKRFHQDLQRLGLRGRRAYDTRRTFTSLTQADGARRDVVRWLTHPPREQVDDYTTLPWATLCEAVACLRIERLAGAVLEIRGTVWAQAGSQGRKSPVGSLPYGAQKWRGVRDSNPGRSAANDANGAPRARDFGRMGGGGVGRSSVDARQTVPPVPRRGGPGGRDRPLVVSVRVRRGGGG